MRSRSMRSVAASCSMGALRWSFTASLLRMRPELSPCSSFQRQSASNCRSAALSQSRTQRMASSMAPSTESSERMALR